MPYTTFGDSGSTLTPAERAVEAARILRRLAPIMDKAEADDVEVLRGWTPAAMTFVQQQLQALELNGEVAVSQKQLWWLRDLNSLTD